MEDISVSSVLQIYEGSHIDEDMLLIEDLSKMPWPTEPRHITCMLLALCTKGKAQYTVDTEEHTVKPGDVIIINEDTVTDDYMFSRDFQGVAILLSSDFFHEVIKGIHELSQLFLFSRLHPVFNLTESETEVILSYYKIIKLKVDDVNHHFRKDVVRSLMMSMIYDISNSIYRLQKVNDKRQTRAEAIFANFIRLVEANFRHERRVSWYGQQLCITPKYLSETVKQVSHRTPNEWIDNYVVLEIRVLLRNSSMSIKEIAQTLNFTNQSFLGKYFKEHVGVSPTKYRRT